VDPLATTPDSLRLCTNEWGTAIEQGKDEEDEEEAEAVVEEETEKEKEKEEKEHRKLLTCREVVVSHGYFDFLAYATTHSVIDQVLESDVDNIFVHDTQRLENGNV
jgi:hypothetical protein